MQAAPASFSGGQAATGQAGLMGGQEGALGFQRAYSCFQELLLAPVLPWGENWGKSVSGVEVALMVQCQGAQGCLRRCVGGQDHAVSQVWLVSWWASFSSRNFISFFFHSNWKNVGSL